MLIDRFWDTLLTWSFVYLALGAAMHFFFYRLNFVRTRKIQPAADSAESIRRQIAWSALYLIATAGRAALLLWLLHTGTTKIYLDFHQYGLLYFVFSVLIYLVGFDLYFYVLHRLLHRGVLYHHIHSVHHAVTAPSVFSIFCMHPLEAVLFAAYPAAMLILLPLHPLALALAALVIHQANLVGHFGHELFPRWFARRVPFISSATYHDIHHQTGAHNYAYFFNWLDWIFNTAKADYAHIYERTFSRADRERHLHRADSVN